MDIYDEVIIEIWRVFFNNNLQYKLNNNLK